MRGRALDALLELYDRAAGAVELFAFRHPAAFAIIAVAALLALLLLAGVDDCQPGYARVAVPARGVA